MLKSSTEMIVKAKQVFRKMLERCLDKDEQPSYTQMYYAGYCDGVIDSGKGYNIDTSWHYIELEGYPPTDDKCWCLIQADRYQDTEIGWYDKEKGKWNCNYWNVSYEKVIAWHMLPTINN